MKAMLTIFLPASGTLLKLSRSSRRRSWIYLVLLRKRIDFEPDTCTAQPSFSFTKADEPFLHNLFYTALLKSLDEERIYFNKEDISRLSAYRFKLDEEIKQSKTDFLKLIVNLYAVRLQQADKMTRTNRIMSGVGLVCESRGSEKTPKKRLGKC